MTQVAEKHSAVADSRSRSARRPDRAGCRRCATRGAARFAALGFPTVRNEEWRFTSVAPIAGAELSPAPAATTLDEPARHVPVRRCAPALVFVNGRFAPALSRTAGLPDGVRFGSLARPIAGDADVGAHCSASMSTSTARAFAALNTAFAADGAYVSCRTAWCSTSRCSCCSCRRRRRRPRRATMSPSAHADRARRAQPGADRRDVRRPARPAVLHQRGHGGRRRRARGARSLQGAGGERRRVPHRAACTCTRRAARTSRRTRSRSAASWSGTTSIATLAGEGAECTLNGLYLADGDRLVDNHTTIDHAQPHCPSHEIYKGILGGKARAVFNGKIIVRPDAQKTDAKQTNRALLLSDDATINTKPQLEIFADDVKCTHGAAIGQLDEDALFYLRARGLDDAGSARHADSRVCRGHPRPRQD